MDARIPALAEQLLLIERELRVLGLWARLPPSDEALSSRQPFAVDVLAFEEWLQWIFLPRMKRILESGSALPVVSGVRPMAEMVYAERLIEVGRLLQSLGEVDRLISNGD
ncbi:YqcC family protein [Azotobacter chroococcum]|uniref:YqcC family protein n=1 Tax=Azotobacter chroococcum TaxID=353 RepID=A0AA44C8D0_9GAMM|nr:YqcC family protein [Azotobacter chroococcum]NHN79339.1 YqcC family protein [Azotobacter chroococcum]TBW13117.1 YqcC family protein [Azotobacter chroococcum subsp. isscasi]